MRFRQLRLRSVQSARRGFNLVETAVATILVGFLLVASLNSAGASLRNQTLTSQRVTAEFLANGLMNEILSQEYVEPGLISSALGRDSGESGGSRANYDDVDDYRNWSSSPPQNQDGSSMSGYTGWQQDVEVEWVSVDNIQSVSFFESGVKRIAVTISRNGTFLAKRIAVQVNAP
jgi:type II secretory pathway pseudopilin PulG